MITLKKSDDFTCAFTFNEFNDDYLALVYKYGVCWPCFIFPNSDTENLKLFVKNLPYDGFFFFGLKVYKLESLTTVKYRPIPKWATKWVTENLHFEFLDVPVYEREKWMPTYKQLIKFKEDFYTPKHIIIKRHESESNTFK